MCCKYVKIQTLIRDQRQRIIRSQLFIEEKFHPDRFEIVDRTHVSNSRGSGLHTKPAGYWRF